MKLALLPKSWRRADAAIREGRFQRWLSLIAGLSSALSGIEVAYEHYKGSYSRRVMYTPVILSAALTGAGVAGFFNRKAAVTILRGTSLVTLADSVTGFYFHIRGMERKPGRMAAADHEHRDGAAHLRATFVRRFRLSGLAGLVSASRGRPWQPAAAAARARGSLGWLVQAHSHEPITWKQDIREGRFQKHLAVATALAAFFSGFEAWYSHYKNNFRYKAQWTPVIIAPLLMAAAIGAVKNQQVAHTWLPAISALALVDGGVGFFYHARGVVRRPGGLEKPVYNIIYGPPVFAPLLFAACGFLGVLASLLRREKKPVERKR